MSDDETIALRVTEIGGQRHAEDFTVIWRGMSIGWIMKASGVPHDKPIWSWNCYVHCRPSSADDSGTGRDLDKPRRWSLRRNGWRRIHHTWFSSNEGAIRIGGASAVVARRYLRISAKHARQYSR
jgi:hypothetical protein